MEKEENDLFFNLMLKLPMYPQVTQQRLNQLRLVNDYAAYANARQSRTTTHFEILILTNKKLRWLVTHNRIP